MQSNQFKVLQSTPQSLTSILLLDELNCWLSDWLLMASDSRSSSLSSELFPLSLWYWLAVLLVIAPVRVSSSVPSGDESSLLTASGSDLELREVLAVDFAGSTSDWLELELDSDPLLDSRRIIQYFSGILTATRHWSHLWLHHNPPNLILTSLSLKTSCFCCRCCSIRSRNHFSRACPKTKEIEVSNV